ncbi:hypothetical protein QC761_0044990 [Podospora bellae-mahoneyi]|uniref:Uncharacterized protein n=1 Tax=Podospora bellae-mahoneyi TaxID=2093777 RepID=A0ABR0FRS1_9PEZI|nr:hypothetical protein QC761_0044990 [Podospora bellae-mahoneyi]
MSTNPLQASLPFTILQTSPSHQRSCTLLLKKQQPRLVCLSLLRRPVASLSAPRCTTDPRLHAQLAGPLKQRQHIKHLEQSQPLLDNNKVSHRLCQSPSLCPRSASCQRRIQEGQVCASHCDQSSGSAPKTARTLRWIRAWRTYFVQASFEEATAYPAAAFYLLPIASHPTALSGRHQQEEVDFQVLFIDANCPAAERIPVRLAPINKAVRLVAPPLTFSPSTGRPPLGPIDSVHLFCFSARDAFWLANTSLPFSRDYSCVSSPTPSLAVLLHT